MWYVFDSETDAVTAENSPSEGRSDKYIVARNADEALTKAKQAYGEVGVWRHMCTHTHTHIETSTHTHTHTHRTSPNILS